MNRFLILFSVVLPIVVGAQPFIVKDGKPDGVIVIAKEPSRSTRWAAKELQETIEKISGAKLPIATQPGSAVAIYVGESIHSRKLGLTAKGLEHGAYRMVAGENWLALIGDDTDFVPREPWAKNNGGRRKLQPLWEEASGLPYGVSNGGMYKNRERMPADIAKEEPEYFWAFDERGSYNAVCGFLRRLGARWYSPGPLGEVLPNMASIPLPKIDETARPDFEVRQFSVRFGTADDEVTRWAMRLGIRHSSGLMIAHGMHTMTHPEALKAKHPDWFALYGGKRDTVTGKRLNHLCYSNEELFRETVKWAQAQFDVYDSEGVSIMPPDAYGSICQCELCAGKQIDAMGARGKLSNHVWDYANRVAKEVGKTHPGKWIVCCAYGANTEPPTNIDQLEPNVQVVIVGGRRPRNSLPEQRDYIRKLRAGWLKLTDQPIIIFENYPFTGRGTYLPAFVAETIGRSINATKGVSRGEDIWLSFPRRHDDPAIGFDHFQVYFTARMWWGGKDAKVTDKLREYCAKFYGSAGSQMFEFFNYCERNYQAMEKEIEPVQTALKMIDQARSQVPPDSIHARRVALIDTFLNALRSKAKQLAQGRGPVARVRTVFDPREPIVIDGKLDEDYWVKHRKWSVSRLRELQTGSQPIFGTTVMAGWDRGGQNLYFAIRCDERPGAKLNITATKHDDEAIWYGDVIEIELATDSHSYYQIAVNPAGALADLDRGANKSSRFRWESQAEVATHVADDHWIVEIRIPVTEDENDPLNQVIGRKPSTSLPWHFNVCRQRARENGTELSAISPTGKAGFHVPLKFAHFHDGRSHAFEVDETVTDFLIEFTAASKLKNRRQYAEAIAAFEALADYPKATDFQKSRVFAEAAYCARSLRDYTKAAELAAQIPSEPIAKTAQIEILLAQRNWTEVIAQFGEEDLQEWPFTEIGAGAFARGRAYYGAKDGDKAETDYQLALDFTTDPRMRLTLLGAIARNRETVLKNEDLALETYREIAASTANRGGADYFSGLQAAARLLTARKQFDEAMKILDQVDAEKLGGSWSASMHFSRAVTLAAAGKKAEALKAYRAVLKNKSTSKALRTKAETALEEFTKN
jgi:tetratricopeptide (TPR) repeat protein